jgi:hypothetical protein
MTEKKKKFSGFMLIIGATVVAGIASYLVTWLVYRVIGAADYKVFAVFWAAIYLVVGGLSGIQQEVTRATFRIEPGSRHRASRARNFAIVIAAAIFAVVLATSPLWASTVFPAHGLSFALPLAVGTASYVVVAVLAGSLYGISQWRSVSLMIAFDAILRLLLVGGLLLLTRDVVALAWVVALPFPLAILVLWPFIRGGFVGRTDIHGNYRILGWNVSRTVVASVSMAATVSGLPLLLGLAGSGVSDALLGDLIFAITLTRAPLVVTLMSLQSYLLVRFRDHPGRLARTLAALAGILVVGGGGLAALGWWLGPPVFALLKGHDFPLDGSFIALMVVSSIMVAALTVTGTVVLARGNHVVYSAGWLVAAIVTILVLFWPTDFLPRVALALIVGPIAGFTVHAIWIAVAKAKRPTPGER